MDVVERSPEAENPPKFRRARWSDGLIAFVIVRPETTVLRITVYDAAGQVELKPEGKLGGVWVPEREGCWRAALLTPSQSPTSRGPDQVEGDGTAGGYLLALITRAGVQFVASGSVISHLISECSPENRPLLGDERPEGLTHRGFPFAPAKRACRHQILP
jgi:hypothetical protein